MNKKEIERWEKHLSNEREKLGIETFRGRNERGSFKIESDTGKCKICGKETHYLLFLDKYNQGTGLCVCKECLKEAIDQME